MSYDHHKVDAKWQKYWEKNHVYRTHMQSNKPKYYILDMFPYPSGQGLHVGHPKGYVGSDIVARYRRMKGFEVLHPMGWDAFGLPTERQAVKEGIHPAEITRRNTDTFRNQLKKIGLSYDWDREINTSQPDYYRWTQWIFLKLYEKGLAYQAEVAVNWCPAMGTVLANEEVKDGLYVETGDPVEQRLMKQWMFKITEYGDRLLEDLEDLDWPESLKEMQRHWIGKSEGALVHFAIEDHQETIDVFTTRPDTLFGGTYCVLAPEHALIAHLTTAAQKETVEAYVEEALKRSERDRLTQIAKKTGVFTGSYALNPVNGQKMPIWVSDYVLGSYGTGAVFACPAHDERDWEFAAAFALPMIEVVSGGDVDKAAYTEDGPHINSEFLDGLMIDEAKRKIVAWLEANGKGKAQINYRLRDWLFSRQRYWGDPFPMVITADGEMKPVPLSELPVELPHLDNFNPTDDGQPPLARATDWMHTTLDGEPVTRETNTMPQWAGSCWYYLRYLDPHNKKEPWNGEIEQKWMPVDLYVGGTEHATLHLLYARFWHKVLYDLGLVSTKEPFQKLFNQGKIQARSFKDARGKYYYPNEVEERQGEWFVKGTDTLLDTRIEKMSKSKHNVVTPDETIDAFGADALRVYEVFMGPLEDDAIWQTENMTGVRRFLERTWRLYFPEGGKQAPAASIQLERLYHKTLKKVGEDLDLMHPNTAVSAMMIFINEATREGGMPNVFKKGFAQMLAPFAPHLAEEFWASTGEKESIALSKWPVYSEAKTMDSEIEIPVQVNGKTRGKIFVKAGCTEASAREAANNDEKLEKYIKDFEVVKVIYITDRMLNLVVRPPKKD